MIQKVSVGVQVPNLVSKSDLNPSISCECVECAHWHHAAEAEDQIGVAPLLRENDLDCRQHCRVMERIQRPSTLPPPPPTCRFEKADVWRRNHGPVVTGDTYIVMISYLLSNDGRTKVTFASRRATFAPTP